MNKTLKSILSLVLCVCFVLALSACGKQNNDTTANNTDTNVSNNTITQNTKNSSLVNINTAATKELSSITGIGESKASNIVKYREENGNFSSIEDIKNVSGIGDSLFEKIKKYITV